MEAKIKSFDVAPLYVRNLWAISQRPHGGRGPVTRTQKRFLLTPLPRLLSGPLNAEYSLRSWLGVMKGRRGGAYKLLIMAWH